MANINGSATRKTSPFCVRPSHKWPAPGTAHAAAQINNVLPVDRSIRLLDAGCGNGRYARAFAELGYERVYGVDLFRKLRPRGFTYVAASLEDLPLRAGVFDFVYSNSVIFHINDLTKVVGEFSRVTRKGGILFITSHTRYSLFTFWRKWKLLFGAPSVEHLSGATCHSVGQCRKQLERVGFDVLLMDGYRASAIVYPMYQRATQVIYRTLGLKLPTLKPRVTASTVLARTKALLAYHFILVAQKR